MAKDGVSTAKRAGFVAHTRRHILRGLARSLPPVLPAGEWRKKIFDKASKRLKIIRKILKVKRFKIAQNQNRKKQLELQMLAEHLFKGKKYFNKCDTSRLFSNERLNSSEKYLKNVFMRTVNEKYVYGIKAVKFDRKGYNRRTRFLIMTNESLCLSEIHKNRLKTKEKIPLMCIQKLEVTSGRDNFLLIKISPLYKNNKGDIILEVPYLIEFITKLVHTSKNYQLLNINELANNQKLLHDIKGSKNAGVIELKENGSTPSITKSKNKTLIVCG